MPFSDTEQDLKVEDYKKKYNKAFIIKATWDEGTQGWGFAVSGSNSGRAQRDIDAEICFFDNEYGLLVYSDGLPDL